jgi:hypothetical protein
MRTIMRISASLLALAWFAASAQSAEPNFDPQKLCQWQHDNNSMDLTECIKLEEDGRAAANSLKAAGDKARLADCEKEANEFAVDSGFASYAVYAGCLKDGPGAF